MMNMKTFLTWIYNFIWNYNLFTLEEDDYDDTNADPVLFLRKQKYKTRLYITLFTVFLYILFYGSWIKVESETIIISNVTSNIVDELFSEYGQTVSCPCSTNTILYQHFLSNNVTMHPVCSSDFIRKEWIEGLYFSNASQYGIWDFRRVAYSQFELLSRLCLISQKMASQIETDVDNTELVNINLLSSKQIQLEINNTIEFRKNNALGQMISFLNYWHTTIDRTFLVSALGTNWMLRTSFVNNTPNEIFGLGTPYLDINAEQFRQCGNAKVINPAILPSLSIDLSQLTSFWKPDFTSNITIVKGFFVTCTSLDALFESTMDCLYEFECVQLLIDYFPKLNQVFIIST
ncbi:unnamed protein product [Adineta ricciae]|uniref:Uncharacterized protein n=1 Tax=Adineta ricciae TaxID=249248 RepID=A0A815V8U0_ADIRI|nr:unnamed protein product [Adineta ricciae]CAF1563938.1 unnamed protein product [Adineta ricciae]